MRLLQENEIASVSGMGLYDETSYNTAFACYPMYVYQAPDSAAFSFVKDVLRTITAVLRTDASKEKYNLTGKTPGMGGIRG